MAQFTPLARNRLWIHRRVTRFCRAGFPHSEISGSTVVCTSPELIAAYHVLHRLPTPRHPPCALSSFTQLASKEDTALLPKQNVKERIWPLPANPLNGGDNRARTGNPRLAKAVLSQLSYIPKTLENCLQNLVGLGRLELPTSRLSGVRSNQLSYRPDKFIIGSIGNHIRTSSVVSRGSARRPRSVTPAIS